MNGFLRQSTASQVRTIGPFVSDSDFKTLSSALTIANTDIKLKKNGGASASKNSGGGTADGTNGLYQITLDATDTATVGELSLSVKVAGALVYFTNYTVLTAAAYDATFASTAVGYVVDQPVNITKCGGTTVTARDIGASVLLSPGTGTGQVNLSSGAVPVTGDLTATMKTSVQTELTTYGALKPTTAGRTLDVTTTGEAGLDFGNTVGTIPDSAGVTTLLSRVTSTIFSGITSLKEWLGAMAGKQVANSTARTEIRSSGAGSGTFDETTDSNEAIRDNMTGGGSDPWSTAIPGAYASGTAGNILGNRLDVAVSTRASQTSLDAVDDYVDTEVAAIKSKTDQLTFTVANKVDASAAVSSSDLNAIADSLLKRDWTSVSGEAAYSALNAMRMLRNVWNTTGGTLTVKKEDGTTTAWNRTLATDPTAQPIVGAS